MMHFRHHGNGKKVPDVKIILRGDSVIKKEMIAMLLAGGQGSRLGVLTSKVAKPAVAFGGKYRIIDFPLSNCINSGVDTVGVLTQYQPLRLNTHIGIGIPWDLDRNVGGVTVLPPYNPEYVLILSGDHIYKMDYEVMLDFHKATNADVTIAVMPVPMEEASRFGIVVTDENNVITDFQEKPAEPKSNLASMGIYIFSWKALRESLIALKDQSNCDFGKHIIPWLKERGDRMAAYEFNGYWKDVGTLGSYWEANMELIDIIPEFNLYEEFWKIYTSSEIIAPQYISADAKVDKCIVGDGTEIYGEVHNSVIGPGVTIKKGAVGNDVEIGIGEEAPNKFKPAVYAFGLAVIGEKSAIPAGVKIGKNTAISGITTAEDYPNGILESGESIIKEGDMA